MHEEQSVLGICKQSIKCNILLSKFCRTKMDNICATALQGVYIKIAIRSLKFLFCIIWFAYTLYLTLLIVYYSWDGLASWHPIFPKLYQSKLLILWNWPLDHGWAYTCFQQLVWYPIPMPRMETKNSWNFYGGVVPRPIACIHPKIL